MRRGEVWWVEHPELGRHPHLVLTRAAAVPVLNAVIAVPATRTARGIPTEVALTRADGMPRDCVLTLDNVLSVPKPFFRAPIASLSAERMSEVCGALRYATGCD